MVMWTACESHGDNMAFIWDNHWVPHTSPTVMEMTHVQDVITRHLSYTRPCHAGIGNDNVSHNPQHLLQLLDI